MQTHFAQVIVVPKRSFRGNLAAAHRPASWLVTHKGPEPLTEASAPYVVQMQDAAGRTAAASSILEAALGTPAMLKTCGDCHRAIGAKPAIQLEPPRLAASGVVGRMLAHQHAADQMLQGLVVPSDALWREGAAGLSTPPLDDGGVPATRSSRKKRGPPNAGSTCSPSRRAAPRRLQPEPSFTGRSWPVVPIATLRTRKYGDRRDADRRALGTFTQTQRLKSGALWTHRNWDSGIGGQLPESAGSARYDIPRHPSPTSAAEHAVAAPCIQRVNRALQPIRYCGLGSPSASARLLFASWFSRRSPR